MNASYVSAEGGVSPVPEIVLDEPGVAFIPRDEQSPLRTFTALRGAPQNWLAQRLDLSSLHHVCGKGQGVKIAILDVRFARSLVGGWVSHQTPWPGLPIMCRSAMRDSPSHNTNQHSAMIASIIGASRDNSTSAFGIAPDSQIYVIEVMSQDGVGSDRDIASGIDMAREAKCDIINLSMGGPGPMPQTAKALRAAEDAGILVFAAAGNEGPGRYQSFPSSYEQCVSVAATNQSGRIARFSSRHASVDLAAPGEMVAVGLLSGEWGVASGTSFASPAAAAVAAVLLSFSRRTGGGDAAAAEVLAVLLATAKDMLPPGVDEASGRGEIDTNAAAAVMINDDDDDLPVIHQSIPLDTPALRAAEIKISVTAKIGAAWQDVYTGDVAAMRATGVASVTFRLKSPPEASPPVADAPSECGRMVDGGPSRRDKNLKR